MHLRKLHIAEVSQLKILFWREGITQSLLPAYE